MNHMRRSFPFRAATHSVPAFTAALLAAGVLHTANAQVQSAGTVFVNVDATTLAEGSLTSVTNNGTLGGIFSATGGTDTTPRVATAGGTKGIQFDGNDFLQNVTPDGTPIVAPDGLVGPDPTQSIEVWALNPAIDTEETLVSWGHRGGSPDGSNMAFNYGSDFRWGAVGHWGNPDMGWNNQGGAPAANQWHYLVYTYDGTTSRVYADGVFQNGEYLGPGILNTFPDTTILLGAQTDPDGTTVSAGARFSGTVGRVRVDDGVLTPQQILNNYNFEKSAFINPTNPPPTVLTPARLAHNPVHRYSFSEASGDATGLTFHDSVANADGQVQGAGATFSGSRLVLPGGTSDTAAYGDLPNGLLSTNSISKGGSGGFTFETWAKVAGSRTWSRLFDFGSTGTQGAGDGGFEVTTPGGSGNGVDYFMLTAQIGDDVNTRRFEVRNDLTTNGAASVLMDVPTRTFGTEMHIVATWDETSNRCELYENGVHTGGFVANGSMADINDVNVWLGRSNFLADQDAQVEYNEVRLYNYALSPAEVLGNDQAGPDNLNNTELGVTIATQPQNVTTDETGIATFRVSAPGSSPVSLQWFRNGVAIPGANSAILTLTNVSAADNNASFTVTASNTISSGGINVTSAPVKLTVSTPVVTLKHRYSFDETAGTNVTDSVSGKNGMVVGSGTFGGGQLALDGTSAYVDLPNGIITALGNDATLELWITDSGRAIWSRIFDFGISDQGEDAQGNGVDFLFLTASDGDGYPRFDANFPDGGDLVVLDPAPPGFIPGNEETHIAITWNSTANISRFYINGVPVATGIAPKPLSAMNNQDVNVWAGPIAVQRSVLAGKI